MTFHYISTPESATINAKNAPVKSQPNAHRRAGIVIQIVTLVVLVGCAPAPKQQTGPLTKEPVISRPDTNRPGFIIQEPAEIEAQTRNDFDSAVNFMNQAQYTVAIDLLKKVIARAPDLTAPHINIAMAYDETGETQKAEEHLKVALDLIPGHPVASNVYGLLLRKYGRFSEAREVFGTTLRLFPEYLPTRLNFGILCELYLREPVTALKQYEIYSEAVPEDKTVKIWIASLRLNLESGQ
jgi:Tfp pilus assembly protein PilF